MLRRLDRNVLRGECYPHAVSAWLLPSSRSGRRGAQESISLRTVLIEQGRHTSQVGMVAAFRTYSKPTSETCVGVSRRSLPPPPPVRATPVPAGHPVVLREHEALPVTDRRPAPHDVLVFRHRSKPLRRPYQNQRRGLGPGSSPKHEQRSRPILASVQVLQHNPVRVREEVRLRPLHALKRKRLSNLRNRCHAGPYLGQLGVWCHTLRLYHGAGNGAAMRGHGGPSAHCLVPGLDLDSDLIRSLPMTTL